MKVPIAKINRLKRRIISEIDSVIATNSFREWLDGETFSSTASQFVAINNSFIFREKINLVTVLCFALFLSIFIVLRFAFLKDLFLPSYFDSAEHYHLISLIIDSYRIGEISNGLKDVFYRVLQ